MHHSIRRVYMLGLGTTANKVLETKRVRVGLISLVTINKFRYLPLYTIPSYLQLALKSFQASELVGGWNI